MGDILTVFPMENCIVNKFEDMGNRISVISLAYHMDYAVQRSGEMKRRLLSHICDADSRFISQ